MKKINLPALLAAALLAIPAISVAENLVSAEDPLDFKLYSVEMSTYEGDPAAGTKVGPQKCLAVKVTEEGGTPWFWPKQMIDIDPAKRYRLKFSTFSEAEAAISCDGTCQDDSNQGVQPYWVYGMKAEDGKTKVTAPTGGWVSMEAVIGPGEAVEWPPGAAKTYMAIRIKAEPGTVVYVKDLSAEEVR